MCPITFWDLAPMGVAEEERLCIYCDLDTVEDEFHFVFYCPLYHGLRQRLFDRCRNQDLMWLNDAERLVWLFEFKVFALGEYLEKAWDMRTKKSYK